jgi:hypothetical protein
MAAPGGWPGSRTRGELWRPAEAARCPRVRASAAAAVGFRPKASGRRVVRGVPAGASRPLVVRTPTLPPCRVRGHAPTSAPVDA